MIVFEIEQEYLSESILDFLCQYIDNTELVFHLNEGTTKADLLRDIKKSLKNYSEHLTTKPHDFIDKSISKWIEENHELSKLWKDVAVNASGKFDNPSVVADEVLINYKKTFKIK